MSGRDETTLSIGRSDSPQRGAQTGGEISFSSFVKASFASGSALATTAPLTGTGTISRGEPGTAFGLSKMNAAPQKLLTGADANVAADRIANQAWHPPAAMRAPADEQDPGYTSLKDTLKDARKNGKSVVATYGEMIFLGDGKTPMATQQRNVSAAIAKLRESPTGRDLVDGIADKKGLPMLVTLNTAGNAETQPAETQITVQGKNGKPQQLAVHAANYDRIDWDPTVGMASRNGTAPPWLILGHELQHEKQFNALRDRNVSKTYPDGMIQSFKSWETDARGAGNSKRPNGIADIEDDATNIENRILREIGRPPARTKYDEDFTLVRVPDAVSFPRNRKK